MDTKNYSWLNLYFPAFALNTERYSVSLRIQSKCWKKETRITLNTDTFHAVEAIARRSSIEKVFFKILQNSRDTTFAGVFFFIKLQVEGLQPYCKRDFSTVVNFAKSLITPSWKHFENILEQPLRQRESLTALMPQLLQQIPWSINKRKFLVVLL